MLSLACAYTDTGTALVCDSCVDCTNAIKDGSRDVIYLNQSISNQAGFCILDPAGFENKTLDCLGNTIGGDSVDLDVAVAVLANKSNITIRNCTMTGFGAGIYLGLNITDTLIRGNTFSFNTYGIGVLSSNIMDLGQKPIICSNVTIDSNSFDENQEGILIDSKDIIICDNDLTDNSKGVNLNSATDTSIIGNRFDGHNISISVQGDYYIDKKILDNVITSNNISNSQTGIFLDAASGNNISDNHIQANMVFDITSGHLGAPPLPFRNTIKDNTFLGHDFRYLKRLGYPAISMGFGDNSIQLDEIEIAFDYIYVKNINETPLADFTYELSNISPDTGFTLTKERDKLYISNPTRRGIYSFDLTIIDPEGNDITRRYYYFTGVTKSQALRYYLTARDPTHGQIYLPKAMDDTGSFDSIQPSSTEESWCENWNLYMMDNITPLDIPSFYYKDDCESQQFIVDYFNFSFWFGQGFGSMPMPPLEYDMHLGVQWDVTWGGGIVDFETQIPQSPDEWTWVERDLQLNKAYLNPESFYLFAAKIGGWDDSSQSPHTKTNETHPSYADLSFATFDPTGFADITDLETNGVLSLRSITKDAQDELNLVMEGAGISSMTIDMFDDRLFAAYYDGILCDENNTGCNSTQENTVLNLQIVLSGEHELLIKPLPKLILNMTFDDPSELLKDYATGHDGIPINSPTQATGTVLGALNLSGFDAASIPQKSDFAFMDDAFTLSMWVKSDEPGTLLDFRCSGINGLQLYGGPQSSIIQLKDMSTDSIQSVVVADFTDFHHLTIDFNRARDTLKIYLDGELYEELPSGLAETVIPHNCQVLHLGAERGYISPITGLLDEIRLWEGSLSAEEIRDYYYDTLGRAVICGDDICEDGEDHTNCPADCTDAFFDLGFNNPSGEWRDNSIHRNEVELFGAPTYLTSWVEGGAVSLDGDDGLEIKGHPVFVNDTFSISFWIDLTGPGYILDYRCSGINGFTIGARPNRLELKLRDMDWNSQTVYTFGDFTEPAHILYDLNRTRGTVRVYVDDLLQTEDDITVPGNLAPHNCRSVYLGAERGYIHPFIGKLDEVRFWDRSLVPSDL